MAILLSIVALSTVPSWVLAADEVWISRGSETGQGALVLLGSRCLGITAGHLAGEPNATLTLVDAARNSATALVLAIDTTSDLALLEIVENRAAGRALCARTPKSLRVSSREQSLQAARLSPNVWLDKVNSASGESTRFNMNILAKSPPEHLYLVRSTSRFGNADPQPGDSGSSVWIATHPSVTPERLYMPDGRPRPTYPGHQALLGLYIGRSQEASVVVPGDRVRDFVLNALEPVESTNIALSPAGVKLFRAERGAFAAAGKGTALEIDSDALETLSLELDLGRRETTVSAVTVLTELTVKPLRGTAKQRLSVQSSAYRPEDSGAWAKERCAPVRGRSNSPGTRCEFSSPRVARGLRLEIDGGISSIRMIEVETQDR